jgi:hypothetical protein
VPGGPHPSVTFATITPTTIGGHLRPRVVVARGAPSALVGRMCCGLRCSEGMRGRRLVQGRAPWGRRPFHPLRSMPSDGGAKMEGHQLSRHRRPASPHPNPRPSLPPWRRRGRPRDAGDSRRSGDSTPTIRGLTGSSLRRLTSGTASGARPGRRSSTTSIGTAGEHEPRSERGARKPPRLASTSSAWRAFPAQPTTGGVRWPRP